MLMPHAKRNRIRDYWSVEYCIVTPILIKLFTRDRFRAVLTNLHFSNNQSRSAPSDLYKIRSNINELKKNCYFFAYLKPYKKLLC